MLNTKTKVIPVIIGATGTNSKSLRQYPNNILYGSKELHTGHCTHTAGSADVKRKRLIVGNSITCTVYCDSRIAATLYSVGTWFV